MDYNDHRICVKWVFWKYINMMQHSFIDYNDRKIYIKYVASYILLINIHVEVRNCISNMVLLVM